MSLKGSHVPEPIQKLIMFLAVSVADDSKVFLLFGENVTRKPLHTDFHRTKTAAVLIQSALCRVFFFLRFTVARMKCSAKQTRNKMK